LLFCSGSQEFICPKPWLLNTKGHNYNQILWNKKEILTLVPAKKKVQKRYDPNHAELVMITDSANQL